jgi:hypothetical protein
VGERLRRRILGWLRVDLEPHLPPGSEGGCEVFRAGLAYLRYRQIAWFLTQAGTLAGILGLFVFLHVAGAAELPPKLRGLAPLLRPGLWIGMEALGLALFLAQLPFTWLAIRWDYDCRWYLLSERCLRVQEGILTLKEQTFTLANIQDIQVKQNPLQRVFGLWDVEVRTAGGGEEPSAEAAGGHEPSLHTAVLRGVEDGAGIRDRLLARMARYGDAGLGEASGEATGEAPDLAQALARVRREAQALRSSL